MKLYCHYLVVKKPINIMCIWLQALNKKIKPLLPLIFLIMCD